MTCHFPSYKCNQGLKDHCYNYTKSVLSHVQPLGFHHFSVFSSECEDSTLLFFFCRALYKVM